MKFMRLLAEMEIEVVDVVAAKAFTFDVSVGDGSELGMSSSETDERAIAAAVSQLIAQTLSERGHEIGVKMEGSTCIPWPNDGVEHIEMTLPSMPMRRDDGTIPGIDD